MANRDVNQLFRGPAFVLIAAAGTQPTEEVGYTREGITVEFTSETAEDYVQEVLYSVDRFTTRRGISVSGQLAQLDVTVLGRVLGITPETSSLPLAGDPEELEVALRLVGSLKNMSPVHYYLARARASGATQMQWRRNESGSIPFRFDMLYSSSNRLLLGPSSAQTATLATNKFTRVNAAPTQRIAWYRLSGESGAADQLDDIEAADLMDGEVIRLQIASATMPITINHASGVIELKDSTDWAMTKTADWIDLYYDGSATAWKEIVRYDA